MKISQVSSVQSTHENEIFFNPNAVPTLNADKQALCEGLITETEALNALKDFSANKTPGTDGLEDNDTSRGYVKTSHNLKASIKMLKI